MSACSIILQVLWKFAGGNAASMLKIICTIVPISIQKHELSSDHHLTEYSAILYPFVIGCLIRDQDLCLAFFFPAVEWLA